MKIIEIHTHIMSYDRLVSRGLSPSPQSSFSKIVYVYKYYILSGNAVYTQVNIMMHDPLVSLIGCENVSAYGSDCDLKCPTNCKTNTCQIQDGSCYECNPGWIGGKCTESMTVVNDYGELSPVCHAPCFSDLHEESLQCGTCNPLMICFLI